MTNEWFYPTGFHSWGAEELAAIARVQDSGWWTMGPEVEALESEFAAFHWMKHGIMVNSGSSANLVAVASLFHKQENPLRRGDKAIVPALAWATTYAPLVQHGLDLVLDDCDQTWNANGTQYRGELFVTCPVLGNPCLGPMVFNSSAYHIQDCCESIGAWLGPLKTKKYCGTFGLLNTFSFYQSHQLAAIEGGMILTDDDELAGLCRMLRDHGMTRYQKPEKFEDEYDFRLMGYNLRPLELHAAIARAQLKKLEEFSRHRQMNWNNFSHVVNTLNYSVTMQAKLRNGVMNPFGMAFTCESTEARARLVKALRENSIDCRLPTGGSFRKHFYGRQWADQQTPNADEIHSRGIFLGCAPYDISPEIERALKIIKETL